MTEKIEKKWKIKSLRTPKQQNYRDRLAKLLLSKDKSERYDILEKEKKTNKMYIESSRDGSLSKEIAFSFIEDEEGEVVVNNIKKFKSTDHNDIANLLIEKWYCWELGKNIKDFKWLNHKDIVKKTIQKSPREVDWLFYHGNLEWLDKEIADLLIKEWEIRTLAENIKSFVELDKEIADSLIKKHEEWKIIYKLRLFKWLDKNIFMSIYDWSMKSLWIVSYGLSSFEWLDTEVAKIIIEKWEENDLGWLVIGLSSFNWLDKEIADLLIKEWYIKGVAQNLSSFKNLGEKIKNLLIEKWYDLYVEMYPDKF